MNEQYPLREVDGAIEIDLRQMQQERYYMITLRDKTYYYQLIGEMLHVLTRRNNDTNKETSHRTKH